MSKLIIVPCLHPAALLRGSGDDSSGLAKFEDATIADMRKALRLTRSSPQWDERAIWERDSVGRLKNLFPTVEEVVEFCQSGRGQLHAVDVETSGETPMNSRLLCVGLARLDGRVLCIPFLSQHGVHYWSHYDMQRVRAALGSLLADHNTPKVAHNYIFDSIVLWSHGIPMGGEVHCCYVDSETEFLTEHGWRRFDDVKKGARLATVAADGSLEWQLPVKRYDREYEGDVYTVETAHSRAVVTGNHRMLVRPHWRARGVSGEWEFRRADALGARAPDQFDTRVAFETASVSPGSEMSNNFYTLLGLWITDGSLSWARGVPRAFQIHQDPRGPAIKELRRLAKTEGLVEHGHSMWRWRHSKGGKRVRKYVTELTFTGHSPELAHQFLSWCGRYSKKRRLPEFALKLGEAERAALLRGLLLGDSGLVRGRRVYRTASRGLAGDVQALALSLGYAASIHWAGGCWGVTLWKHKTDRVGAGASHANVTKRRRKTRVVCFGVPNETLVTRSRGKTAFHGNTMQMHHVIDGEMPMGLGYCGTRYLDIRYWKDDVKGDEGWLSLPDETLRSYNLRDCLVTLRLVPIFMARLKQLSLVGLYQEEVQVAGIMGRASVRGLPIDFDRRDLYEFDEWQQDKKTKQWELKRVRGLGPLLVEQMNQALWTMRQLSGDMTFDPLKPTALRQFMFSRLGLPIVKMSKSGVHPSTDKEAMILLALAADTPEQRAGIKALADFKTAHKMKSTFIDGLGRAALLDGRLHVFWKLLAATGRLMSTPNAQNWNKKIKRIFGYMQRFGSGGRKLFGVDLKQAEMRGIAYLAKHERLLAMYQQDLNVHTFNAMLALHVRPKAGHKDLDAATEAYVNVEAAKLNIDPKNFVEMPDVPWAATRTLMKKDGFGRNYGADDNTVFRIERSDRDPDTNEPLFPTLQLSDVQANGIIWAKMNPWTRQWWDDLQREIKLQGFHRCPVSGRLRWFRGGFKRTEMLGHPNQTLIASIVNKRMIEIQGTFDRETGTGPEGALIVQQVHDALNAEGPAGYAVRGGQVMVDAFEQRVPLPGFPDAYFPADKPTYGEHLDEI